MKIKYVDYDNLFNDVQNTFADGDKPGKTTGMSWLDPFYRIEQGEVCVVTGYPGSGKSEFVDYLSVNLSKLHGFKWAYFSPETKPAHYHVRRILQKLYDKSFHKKTNVDHRFRIENLKQSELLEGLEFYEKHYSLIDADNSITIEDIFQIVKKGADERGINAFVIDPWNKIECSRPSGMSETDFIGKTLDKISDFCYRTKISCWIVAHPAKPATSKNGDFHSNVNLYSISGSAHWYNKVDCGLWIYRDTTVEDSIKVEVHILKIKKIDNGKIGRVGAEFNPYSGTYKGDVL